MKRREILLAGVVVLSVLRAFGESCHKAWWANPGPEPADANVNCSLRGPIVDIRQPDPETNCVFRGWLSAREATTTAVERVHLLRCDESGAITVEDIAFRITTPKVTGVTQGWYSIEFETAKVAFRKEDVFAVVLNLNGEKRVLFLRLKLQMMPS